MAIEKLKKQAFSLVEVLVSMIILMIVTTSMIAVLTSSKPRIEETTIQGQFICYYGDDGKLHQWQSNNRTPLTANVQNVTGDSCTLELSKRPAFYYIISVGPGSSKSDGQVKTYYLNQIKDNLVFKPGKYSSKTDTEIIVANSANSIDPAKAGLNASNGLIITNISKCYLKSAGDNCPNGNSGKQEHCKVGSVSYDGGEDVPSIVIEGCDKDEGFCGIKIKDFEKINSDNTMSAYKYTNNGVSVKVNLVFEDGSFIPNQGTDKSKWENSKIGQIIGTIPARRKSKLIDKFIEAKPGVKKQNGAVLVLW